MAGLDSTGEREGEESRVAHEGGRRCADAVGEVLILGVQHIVDGQGEDLQAGQRQERRHKDEVQSIHRTDSTRSFPLFTRPTFQA